MMHDIIFIAVSWLDNEIESFERRKLKPKTQDNPTYIHK